MIDTVPATAAADDVAADPLAAKIARIASTIGRVPKDGENKFHHYRYTTAVAMLEACRDQINAEGLAIFPSMVSGSMQTIPLADTNELLTTLEMEFTVVDSATGTERVCRYPGAGSDRMDKGPYKAVTGSFKYFLEKLFLIPTGDDPEGTTTQSRGEAESDGSSQVELPPPQRQSVVRPKPATAAPAAKPAAAARPAPAAKPSVVKPASTTTSQQTAPAATPVLVKDIGVRSGTNEKGEWHLYIITLNGKVRASDGSLTNSGTTFDAKIALAAETARDARTPVLATVEPNPKKAGTFTLTALTVAPTRQPGEEG